MRTNNPTRAVTRHAALTGLLGALILSAASPLLAQPRWGRAAEPRNGACFHRDPDFRGDYFCTAVGEEIASVPFAMSDRIASIRLFGNAEVTVFQNGRFGGRSTRFDREVPDLLDAGWRDRISSLRVMRASSSSGSGSGYGSSSGSGYGGGRGDSGNRGRGADADRIVRRAYQDILEREPDAPGLRQYRNRIIDDGWSEEKVREELRRSPEYREKHTMTPDKAKEIVRRAYLSVLSREPDAGSQGFVDNVLRNKWTEQDVARELRKSEEYLSKKR